MSDAPRPPEPEDAPSADELSHVAVPAHVRRAPRFARVIGTGVIAGFLAGALCGLLLPNSTGVGRGMVAILVGLGFALIGGIVTGMIAVGLDRGTPRYLKEVRAGEAQAAQTLGNGDGDSADVPAPADEAAADAMPGEPDRTPGEAGGATEPRIGREQATTDAQPNDAAGPAAASAPDPEERPDGRPAPGEGRRDRSERPGEHAQRPGTDSADETRVVGAASPVPAGGASRIRSSGWRPKADVSLSLVGPDGGPVGGAVAVTANAEGHVTGHVTVPVPARAVAGTYTVVGTDEDGGAATARIEVYAPSLEATSPVPAAGRTGIASGGWRPASDVTLRLADLGAVARPGATGETTISMARLRGCPAVVPELSARWYAVPGDRVLPTPWRGATRVSLISRAPVPADLAQALPGVRRRLLGAEAG